MEEQLSASQKNSEALKKKNGILIAELKCLKSSKSINEVSSHENEIKSLNFRLQNQEAEKWALNNDLKISQEKTQSLSQQILELQTYQARYQILVSEMEVKRKESSNLSSRMKQIESNQTKVDRLLFLYFRLSRVISSY